VREQEDVGEPVCKVCELRRLRQRNRGDTHRHHPGWSSHTKMGEDLHLLSKHLPEMRARLDDILAKAPRGQPPASAEPASSVLGWWKRTDPPTKRALTLVALMSVVALLLCGVLYAMTLTAAPAPAPVDRPATIIQALLYEAREQVHPSPTPQRSRSVVPDSFPRLRCTGGRRCGCGRQRPYLWAHTARPQPLTTPLRRQDELCGRGQAPPAPLVTLRHTGGYGIRGSRRRWRRRSWSTSWTTRTS
jgi:hypothetical protein